jgi:hypothetical protein
MNRRKSRKLDRREKMLERKCKEENGKRFIE